MAYRHVPDGPLRVLDEHNVEYQLLHRIWRNERAPLRRLYSYAAGSQVPAGTSWQPVAAWTPF